MSQDTKLKVIPSNYEPIKQSAREMIELALEDVEEVNLTGFMAVLLKPDGDYKTYCSEGIKRHQKIGILTEMIHDLLSEPDL